MVDEVDISILTMKETGDLAFSMGKLGKTECWWELVKGFSYIFMFHPILEYIYIHIVRMMKSLV